MTYETQAIDCKLVTVTEPAIVTCAGPTTHFASGCEMLNHYDIDNDGILSPDEVTLAYNDYTNGTITENERNFVIDAYNARSINALCQLCYVGEANIVATSMLATPSSCEEPCDINVTITWENIGTASGTFTPGYTVNGVLYQDPIATIDVDGEYTLQVTIQNLSGGTYTICPYPNP